MPWCRTISQINLNPRQPLQPNPLHAKWESAMEIGTIWIIVAAFVILLEIWAIWHIIGSDRRAERKMLWIVFVVYAPFPGLLFWAWRGPRAVKGRAVLQEK
ncbi:hypothetical protein BL240_12855 [Pseudomonas putida]|uniref:Cardiolipin synthase N-terminal domain-containing protein n=6 Tax=Pseudomonas TaxID=286 RepID=A0A1L5PQ36_PSEPU|nr:hypothetical protein BL240_12855 [Pseudomonas putida]